MEFARRQKRIEAFTHKEMSGLACSRYKIIEENLQPPDDRVPDGRAPVRSGVGAHGVECAPGRDAIGGVVVVLPLPIPASLKPCQSQVQLPASVTSPGLSKAVCRTDARKTSNAQAGSSVPCHPAGTMRGATVEASGH